MQIQRQFCPEKIVTEFIVSSDYHHKRLDSFLFEALRGPSRSFLANRIKDGSVVVSPYEGKLRPSVKILTGMKITLTTLNGGEGELEEFKPEVPHLVYNDDDVVIIDKPPFMTTHPTGRKIFYCATVWCFDLFEKKEIKKNHSSGMYHSVHRIDRETSGLLVMAKNSKSAKYLSMQFENHQVRKCYLLVAHQRKENPLMEGDSLAITERIKESGESRREKILMKCFPFESSLGKEAHTDFHIVKVYGDFIVALAFPKTGRQHQIRVHAAFHGFPLVGDKIYKGGLELFLRYADGIETKEDKEEMIIERQALHAFALEMSLKNGEEKKVLFTPELPTDFLKLIPQLEEEDLTSWVKKVL